MKYPPLWRLGAPWRRGCLLDALMGMTRATRARGNLRLTRGARIRFFHDHVCYDYRISATAPPNPAAVLTAADDVLFTFRGG